MKISVTTLSLFSLLIALGCETTRSGSSDPSVAVPEKEVGHLNEIRSTAISDAQALKSMFAKKPQIDRQLTINKYNLVSNDVNAVVDHLRLIITANSRPGEGLQNLISNAEKSGGDLSSYRTRFETVRPIDETITAGAKGLNQGIIDLWRAYRVASQENTTKQAAIRQQLLLELEKAKMPNFKDIRG
jgi:hypothetical protein